MRAKNTFLVVKNSQMISQQTGVNMDAIEEFKKLKVAADKAKQETIRVKEVVKMYKKEKDEHIKKLKEMGVDPDKLDDEIQRLETELEEKNEEARKNLKVAVSLFLEEAHRQSDPPK